MIRTNHVFIIIFLIIGVILHIVGKQAGTLQEQDKHTLFITGPSSLIVQQAIAGPCLGLASESNVLSIFALYWSIKEKNLSKEDQHQAWSYLYHHLQQAQSFDPWYWDVYRLTNGLLVYQEAFQQEAFDILVRGAEARTWDWEVPFIAGFLAHDVIKDDELAFHLMNMAIHKEDAPITVIGLAAKFLSKTETVEDSVNFLRTLKSTVPKGYATYIDIRIKELLGESVHGKGAHLEE